MHVWKLGLVTAKRNAKQTTLRGWQASKHSLIPTTSARSGVPGKPSAPSSPRQGATAKQSPPMPESAARHGQRHGATENKQPPRAPGAPPLLLAVRGMIPGDHSGSGRANTGDPTGAGMGNTPAGGARVSTLSTKPMPEVICGEVRRPALGGRPAWCCAFHAGRPLMKLSIRADARSNR